MKKNIQKYLFVFIILSLIFTFAYVARVKMREMRIKQTESEAQINKNLVWIDEVQKKLDQLKSKENLTQNKITILKKTEEIFNKPSNQWNIIFSTGINEFRTIDLYGNAKSQEAKNHIISLISQIPEISVIRESIKISPEMNFHGDYSPEYNVEKDIIRSDVAVISMTEEQFIKVQEEENASENDKMKKIDDEFFNNPLVYDDIIDISVEVTDKVPEIRGILSTQENKDEIIKILNSLKNNGEIFTYIDKTSILGEKTSSEEQDLHKNLVNEQVNGLSKIIDNHDIKIKLEDSIPK